MSFPYGFILWILNECIQKCNQVTLWHPLRDKACLKIKALSDLVSPSGLVALDLIEI